MKKATGLLCVLLCLALLPTAAFGEAGTAAMIPVTFEDVTFYVWSDWTLEETTEDGCTYSGAAAAQPFNANLVFTFEDGLVWFDQTPELVLTALAEGVAETMDEGSVTELTHVGGRDGVFVSGTMYGFLRMEVYMCVSGTKAVAAALVCLSSKDSATLRAMMLEVLGAEAGDSGEREALPEEAPASPAPVSHEILGIPYSVWADWREEAGEGETYYYYKSDVLSDGYMMVSAYESPALSGENAAAALQIVADELSTLVSEDDGIASQPTDIGGRTGLFVSGSFYGLLNMEGYLCLSGNNVVSIIVMDNVSDQETLHGMLLEVLGE